MPSRIYRRLCFMQTSLARIESRVKASLYRYRVAATAAMACTPMQEIVEHPRNAHLQNRLFVLDQAMVDVALAKGVLFACIAAHHGACAPMMACVRAPCPEGEC